MTNISKSYIYLFLAVFLWTPVALFVRWLEPYIDPESMVFFRFAIAAILMGTHLIYVRKTKLSISGKEAFHYLIIGFLYTILVYTFLLAVLKTTIANTSFLQQLAPVWTFLLAHSLLKERATPILWGSLVFSMIGVVIIFSETGLQLLESVWGNTLALLSGISIAFWTIMVRYVGKIQKSDAYVLTFWSLVFGTIFMLPFCLGNIPSWTNIPFWPAWILLLVLGIITVVPFFLFSKATEVIKSQNATLGMLLLVVTVPASGILIGEIPSTYSIVGGFFIATSVFVMLKTKEGNHELR